MSLWDPSSSQSTIMVTYSGSWPLHQFLVPLQHYPVCLRSYLRQPFPISVLTHCQKTLLFLVPLSALLIEFVLCTHVSYVEHLLWVKDVSMQNKREESHFLLQAFLSQKHHGGILWSPLPQFKQCQNSFCLLTCL